MTIRWIVVCFALASGSSCFASLGDLERASPKFKYPERQNLTAVEKHDNTIVAVGDHGLIIRSQDNGQSWRQSAVPVSVHLTDVEFVSDSKLWAVGHRGVILHSKDGGKSWTKQLDGLELGRLIINSSKEKIARIEKKIETAKESNLEELEFELEEAYFSLEDAQLNAESYPASRPTSLLDVRFISEKEGFAVGGYGVALTTSDAGSTWEIIDGISNPDKFDLNSVQNLDSDTLIIAGEFGSLFRSTNKGESWVQVELDSDASFFDVFVPLYTVRRGAYVLGSNGTIFETRDNGKSWLKKESGSSKSYFKGIVRKPNSGSPKPILLSADGHVLNIGHQAASPLSSPQGFEFSKADRVSSAVALKSTNDLESEKFLIVGKDGVKFSGVKKQQSSVERQSISLASPGIGLASNYQYDPNLMIISLYVGENACSEHDALRYLQRLQIQVQELGLTKNIYSMADWATYALQGANGWNPKWYTLEPNQSVLGGVIKHGPQSLISSECDQLNLFISLNDQSLESHSMISNTVKKFASSNKANGYIALKIHNGVGLDALNSLLKDSSETPVRGVSIIQVKAGKKGILSTSYLGQLGILTAALEEPLEEGTYSAVSSLMAGNMKAYYVSDEGFTIKPIIPRFEIKYSDYEQLFDDLVLSGQLDVLVDKDFTFSSIYVAYSVEKESFNRSLNYLLKRNPSFQYSVEDY